MKEEGLLFLIDLIWYMLPDNPKDFWTSSPVIKIKIYKKVTASFPAIVWGKAKPNQKPNLKQNLKKTKTKRQQKNRQKTKNPLRPNMQDIGLDQFPFVDGLVQIGNL